MIGHLGYLNYEVADQCFSWDIPDAQLRLQAFFIDTVSHVFVSWQQTPQINNRTVARERDSYDPAVSGWASDMNAFYLEKTTIQGRSDGISR